jgi:hypothetical protein
MMSNSSLVTYKKLSPNYSRPRNRKIDTITIHCMAGNFTVETCGKIFSAESRKASSQYGIGTDGRIAQYVDESDRSWCTSSAANDNRAITIEVANDSGEPDWHISQKALEALIQLCVDICQRNDIPKLLWKADKNLIGQVDKQNLTVHRWFAAKACPGDYIYNMLGKIADEVNKRLLGERTPVHVEPLTPTLSGPNDEIIWYFLEEKGLNEFAVAGIMGNLYAESGLISNNLQNSFEKLLNHTDEQYTSAVDSGAYKNFVKDKAGYGLAQWTFWSRKEALLQFAKESKRSIGDLEMQLNYLWKEFQGYTNMMKILKEATSVREASDVMLLQFEKPADQSEAVKIKRCEYGQKYYDKFADGILTADIPVKDSIEEVKPYSVRITADELNYRSGPGTNNKVSGVIKDKGVYTITAEASGVGAKRWGKLKSGAGWISLDFTKKI